MNASILKKRLTGLSLGEVKYFKNIGSTNDFALTWAAQGAPDFSLVSADEQTAGRGRGQRSWYTHPGSGLAFSLILRVSDEEQRYITRLSGLGAISVCEALTSFGLTAQIKWPNDILVNRKKVGGILLETAWMGERVDGVVMGIGLNIFRKAVPPPEKIQFPATSLEEEMESSSMSIRDWDKYDLLQQLLKYIIVWRKQMQTPRLISAWNEALAFVGEDIEIWGEEKRVLAGKLVDIDDNGGLRIQVSGGEMKAVNYGEIHLRPVL
jgi:BirA family biotin operon repressor/biotin-[acetyl-CoA-carboxylase] ligase